MNVFVLLYLCINIIVLNIVCNTDGEFSLLQCSVLLLAINLSHSHMKEIKILPQVRLEELKRRLDLESKARAAADAQIVELTVDNSRLRRHLQMLDTRHPIVAASNQMLSSAAAQGMDEDLLKTIEESFQKFHSFLDLLRDAGYTVQLFF